MTSLVLIDFMFSLGLSLGVGGSTFALIFYIKALEDGVIDASEKRLMHTVYVVMRVGILMIFLGLLGFVFAGGILAARVHVYEWFLLTIIIGNAVLMHYRYMPMRFGPVIAGGSWYSLFLASKLPLERVDTVQLIVTYIAFLALFSILFRHLKNTFTIVKGGYGGDVMHDADTLERYSKDASSFKLTPQAVYYPRNIADVVALVELCHENRKAGGSASLTLRAGGTCMSGGPLNTGWIVDMTKYMKRIHIDRKREIAEVEMGVYFRDIEDAAQKYGLMFAAYPSSHRVCGIGGMIGNNASGEKSLRCGATSDNVLALEVVLADGSTEWIEPKPLSVVRDPKEKALLKLNEAFADKLRRATGDVKKSASGYRLEKLVANGMFNAVPIFVGAQGTLGIVTRARLKLTPIPKHLSLMIISAQSLTDIPSVIGTLFEHNPEGIEAFDGNTFKKAEEHLPQFAKKVIPYIDTNAHLYILAQFSEATQEGTEQQAIHCFKKLKEKGYKVEHVRKPEDVTAAWEVRRNSFLLMRDYNPEGHRAVPCIEDVIVPLPELGKFIEKLMEILKRRTVHYGFHGHIGDGSLRVIPVFDFSKPTVGDEVTALMQEVFTLVKKLKGNISADHSDGIIRSPFLKEFYGEELYGVFGEIKNIYDPENIMNPNKKVGGDIALLNRCLDCEVT